MAQNTNRSNIVNDISSSVLISLPYAQSTLSRYLREQEAERLKIYHKCVKGKIEAGNFSSFSICPLLHFFHVSEFKVSSQRNISNAQQTHNVAAEACRRKCNQINIKYFNYGEKFTFQHGISASEALDEYRRTNVYSRSRLYKSSQASLEISLLLRSDIQRITGASRLNDMFMKPTTLSWVTPPNVPTTDGCGESLQEKTNKRRPKEKVPFSFVQKQQAKVRPAVQMSVVSLGMEVTSPSLRTCHNKTMFATTNVSFMKDIGTYQDMNIKGRFHQSAGDANILTFVQNESRDKQRNQPSIKQRRSLYVPSIMPTTAEEPEIAKAMKMY